MGGRLINTSTLKSYAFRTKINCELQLIKTFFFLDFCKGKETGNYANPDDPSGYITCVNGITYKRKCPQGLVWNNEKKVCDWPSHRDATAVKKPLKPVQPAQLPVKPGH